jgi:putative peptidoglycan lipid II flippase
VPAAVGLFVLAEPIITLLFQHGEFTAFDTAQTALALRFYLLGLIFAAIDQPLIFAFYARQNTLAPALVGVASVGVYLAAALAPMLFRPLQMTDLVLADSIKHLAHVTIMFWLLRRWTTLRGHGFERTVAKAAFAAAMMGLGLWFGRLELSTILTTPGFFSEILLVGLLGVFGGAIYLGIIWILRVDELAQLLSSMKGKLKHG